MVSFDAWYVRLARAGFGLFGLVTIGIHLAIQASLPDFSWANFFSYFTILSNIAAGTVLLVNAIWPAPRDWLRGAMTVCMVTTGLVFAILLDSGSTGSTPPWVNTIIHRIMPVVLLLEWVLVRQRHRLSYAKALAWLGIPLVYLGYTLVRGALVQWYPYPFLKPEESGGVLGVLIYMVGIAAGIAVLSLALAWVGNLRVHPEKEPELVG